jgi:penicillin amidase
MWPRISEIRPYLQAILRWHTIEANYEKKRLAFCLILLLSPLVCLPKSLPISAHLVAAAQDKTTSLHLTGLKGRVTVRRDERAIPYIEAATEEDLYFAQGYVTASDRLWQMDLLRRTGRGELSEIFGRDALEEDKQYRAYGFTKLSESLLGQCSTAMQAALEAYARGVNAFIDSRDDKTMPLEFRLLKYKPRAWTSTDTIIIGKTFSVTLSSTWESDIMRAALAYLPADKRAALLPETSALDVVIVGSDGAKKKTAALPSPPVTCCAPPQKRALLPGFCPGCGSRGDLWKESGCIRKAAQRVTTGL